MNPEIVTLMKKYKGDGVALGREKAEQVVNEYICNPYIHNNQYSALVSFCDNIGAAAFIMSGVADMVNNGSSTHLQKLIPERMMQWVAWGDTTTPPTSPSMKKRREIEARVFTTPCLVAHNLKPKKRA
jgi:GH24 family phage-related lysozyme (muramidase)